MTHQFYLWTSYGVFGAAIVIELIALALRRRRALAIVEEERDLEAQD
jgi:heme exporter protein CcmD